MTDLRQVLASNMKLYRKRLGLSQAKLAEKVDTADNYIALIETCKRFPSPEMLEHIAAGLDVDTLELFAAERDKPPPKKALREEILADIEQILVVRLGG